MSSIIDDINAAEAAEAAAVAAAAIRANDPIIDPEFQSLMDELTETSYTELKKLIQVEGVRDPAIVWQEENILLDGHNRLNISKELGIPLPRTDKSFASRDEAKEWIIRNQLGRRNLSQPRYDYYLGMLYNQQVETAKEEAAQPAPSGKAAVGKAAVAKSSQAIANRLGADHGVNPKTVRRHGATAKGIDMLAKVKGKIAKNAQLSAKPLYTAEEMQAVGTAPNVTVAAKTLEKMDAYKEAAKKKKVEDKKVQTIAKEKAAVYSVVLTAPEFERAGFSVATEPKPALDKDAMVYMMVPDEQVARALELATKWGLTYEASLVFYSTKTYDGTYTKIAHEFVFMLSRGHPAIKATKAPVSVHSQAGETIIPTLMKIIDVNHTNGKRLDMRRGAKVLAGWDSLS